MNTPPMLCAFCVTMLFRAQSIRSEDRGHLNPEAAIGRLQKGEIVLVDAAQIDAKPVTFVKMTPVCAAHAGYAMDRLA